MKRVISLITALMLCFALAIPAFATDVEFVPSITAKPAPSVVPGDETTGTPVIVVKNEKDEVVHTEEIETLIVTPVADVYGEAEVEISEEAAAALQEAYEVLTAEDAKLSEVAPVLTEVFEELGLDPALVDTLVATDLFDVTIESEELLEWLDVEGHTVDLTFHANVPADHDVFVLVYKNNEWQTIENVVNNGDGTVTCTFAHFCPVVILSAPISNSQQTEETEAPVEETEAPAVETEAAAPETEAPAVDTPVETEKSGFAWWWIVLVAVAGVAVVVLKNKGGKK